MELLRAAKFRMEPTAEQAAWLSQTAGACRYVYNLALEQRRDHWRPGRKFSYVQQAAEITACRSDTDWLKAAPVHALQCALRAVDAAFERFFAGIGGYPRMKSRGDDDGFRLPDPSYLGFKRLSKRMGAVKLPKIGWIKVRDWRALPGELRNVAITRRAGHWYVSIQCRREVPTPAKSALPPAGLDRGVKVFAALSSGDKIEPINAFKGIQVKLAKLQHRLARKTKFSANWRKLKAKISRLHLRAANARKDFLHKRSTEIAKSHGIVKVEALNVRGMSASAAGTAEAPGRNVAQKSGLNRSILDQGWSMFRDLLRYKLAERGGELVEVPAAYTSQTCSCCGHVDAASRNGERFKCARCGHEDHADTNAAKNILAARTLAPKPPKRTLRRVGKRNQTAPRGAVKESANGTL